MFVAVAKYLLVGGALAQCLLPVAAQVAGAQASSAEAFEDLARRAEAALDSQPAEAAGLYRQALAIRHDWGEGWLYLGAALYQLSRYAEASDAFRKGVELAPGVGTGWAFLGLNEAELGDPDQALLDIRKGEELGLGSNREFETAVRVKAARTLIRASTFDEALAQLQPLAKHNENSPAVVETMGLCALSLPEDLSQISAQRRGVVNLTGRAAWASANQHPEEAAADYRQLLEQYPNEPGVRYAHGLYLMETDLTAALAEFQKEVLNTPKHWPALLVISSIHIRQGTAEPAIQSLREARKIVPAKYRWLCHAELGRANMTADNLDAAIAEFETAVRLMPSNANVHYFLSEALRRAGKKADAQRERAEFEKLKVQQDPLAVPSLRPFAYSGKN
jgi:tetratricopeptide (TPR) repeat protein